MHISWTIQILRYCFFLQSSRYVSNEQSCLKTTGLYDDLLLLFSLFHFFYFIFSVPISSSLCSPISPSLFFLTFFLKPLSSVVEKLLYTYTNMYYIYFRKLTNFCLTKKFMTFWFYLFDLPWIRSDQISHSVVSDSLRPHESQHARPPCPSPTPGVHLDSCPTSGIKMT